jgi:hypothetical protein
MHLFFCTIQKNRCIGYLSYDGVEIVGWKERVKFGKIQMEKRGNEKTARMGG